jgi:hypothetical protein
MRVADVATNELEGIGGISTEEDARRAIYRSRRAIEVIAAFQD